MTFDVDTFRLEGEIQRHMETLRGTPRQIADVLVRVRRERREIASDRTLSEEGRNLRRRESRDRATSQLDALMAAARTAETSVRKAVEGARRQPSTEERLLAETQKSRAWQRYVRLLDGGIQPLEAIERASGDLAALQALAEEMPAYVEAKAGKLQDRTFPGYIDSLLNAIDQAERPLLSPVERKRREISAEIRVGMAQLPNAYSTAQAEVASGWNQTFLLPGWGEGQLIGVGSGA